MIYETRKCKQCGEVKTMDNYRQYYRGSSKRYTWCLTCEKINSRYKYLTKKVTCSDAEAQELQTIEELYEIQTSLGLRPPNYRPKMIEVKDTINDQMRKYLQQIDERKKLDVDEDAPDELLEWLTKPLLDLPDHYNDVIYEELLKKYRPIKYIDTVSHKPVYDETYKNVLSKILARFNEYEDNYEY